MTQEKEVTTAFRLPEGELKRVDELSKRLGLTRSAVIRMGISGVLDQAPKIREKTRAKKAAEVGKKVYDLHKAGKHDKAKELVTQSIKKGVYPVHFYRPEGEKKQ